MNIIQITPGAGAMFCGGCFRDNALVAELRRLGHATLMMPLYLPLTLDEPDQSKGTPIFFSGVNVYLEQKSAFFRNSPAWLHKILASPFLLKLVSGAAGKTRAQDLGEITVSMLRGEEGKQARELDELITWFKSSQTPEIISLSNALLIGMARRLRKDLAVPIVCSLQGEDFFLDLLPQPHRDIAWKTLSERAADVDLFLAPSEYFKELMRQRLGLSQNRIRVIHNGIKLEGYDLTENSKLKTQNFPTLGYFARMCQEKGLHILVEAFIALKKQTAFKDLKLKIGGGCGPGDEPFVEKMRERLKANGILNDVVFFPNLSRSEKVEFLKSLAVFSVPAPYGEAFGLYLIEAMAAGVPVVQPRHAAYPELIEKTGGGILCEPNAASLADGISQLLLNPERARSLGEAGRKAVHEKFSVEEMARNTAKAFAEVAHDFSVANRKL
ncbi:MAG: glycosyltransferase family 4 protein [Verrucomicrobiota bacterium]